MAGSDRLAVLDAHGYEFAAEYRAHVLAGGAVAAWGGYVGARKWAAEVMGGAPHDVWYTERNGDPITLIVPAGTLIAALPDEAKGYAISEWIVPEGEFTGRANVGQ